MSRRTMRVLTAVVAAVALLLAGCSSGGGSRTPSAGSSTPATTNDGFPVTMHHAFGSTTITSRPDRVVAYGWGVADAMLAVGVVPTAMEFQAYGADKHGVPPWVAQKLNRLGVDTPTVLPKTTADPPYEAIAAAHPDVIVAVSSGITRKQYDLLTAIAPTVAYTGKPYTTPWQQVLMQTATAVGKRAQAKAVLADIDKQLAAKAAEHPELAGKTMAAVWDTQGTFYVYKSADARVAFMLDLGLKSAPSVAALANGNESFYYTLSYEKLDELDSDLLVAYSDTQDEMNAFLRKSYARSIPAVRMGAVAQVVGTERVAAVSPPTALSLPWGLDTLVAQLSAAAQKADAADGRG